MTASILPVTETPRTSDIELKELKKPSFPKKTYKEELHIDEEQPSSPAVASAGDDEDKNNKNEKNKGGEDKVSFPEESNTTQRVTRTTTTTTYTSSRPAGPEPSKCDRAMEGGALGALAGGILGVVAGTITGVFTYKKNHDQQRDNETITDSDYGYKTDFPPFFEQQNSTDIFFNNTGTSTPEEIKNGMTIGAVCGAYIGASIGAAVATAFPNLGFGHIAARLRERCNNNNQQIQR